MKPMTYLNCLRNYTVLIVVTATAMYMTWYQIITYRIQKPERSNIQFFQNHAPQFLQDIPIVYCIMPTHVHPSQKAELTRQCSTFRHVQNLIWLIVEDSVKQTDMVSSLLKACPVKYFHLRERSTNKTGHRGVSQRNKGLAFVRDFVMSNKSVSNKGVVYFSDDDNTYDPKIFEEMRNTRRVSMWPVGLIDTMVAERPIVKDGKVVDFYSSVSVGRTFRTDMAAFAFNVSYLLQDPYPVFNALSKKGYLENDFLSSLGIKLHEIEPKAKNCTEVLVWHTKDIHKRYTDLEKPLAKFSKYNLTNLS